MIFTRRHGSISLPLFLFLTLFADAMEDFLVAHGEFMPAVFWCLVLGAIQGRRMPNWWWEREIWE